MTTNPCCLDVLLSDVFKRQSCHREMKLHVGCQPNAVLPTELSFSAVGGTGGENRTHLRGLENYTITDQNTMALAYLVMNLDSCGAREKDTLHLGQWALVPQEAIL